MYLGIGDMRHSVELIEYINPPGGQIPLDERNAVGASHLGIIVDDLEALYADLLGKGVQFLGPPVVRPDRTLYARKVCYLQDPDGIWLEFSEGSPELRYS